MDGADAPEDRGEGLDVEALLSSRATATLIAQFLTQPDAAEAADDPDRLAALTQREREIVALVGTGLTNDEIAERLVVSPLTAKTHVNRSMMKLGVRDRAQLVVFAYQTGLVRTGHGTNRADPDHRDDRSVERRPY